MRAVTIDNERVLLVHVEGEIHAFRDRCVHQALPLSEGRLDGTILTCRAHEWTYDACTGKGINPACTELHSFPVRIEAGNIWVDIEPRKRNAQ